MSDIVDPRTIASGFWDDLDTQDFAIPRVTLGQATSTKGEPGKFNFNTGLSVAAMLHCVLIVPRKTRVLYQGKGKSRCASDNFYEPSRRISEPVTTNCLTCPLAQWGDDPVKNEWAQKIGDSKYDGKKPLCTETYNLLMADNKWNLFNIGFQKVQLKTVSEKLFTRLRYNFGGVPPFHVAFDMEATRVSGNDRVYYTVDFKNFRELDEEGKSRATSIYQGWKDRFGDALAKQHEDMDNEKSEPKDVTPSYDEAPMPDSNDEIPF